MKSVALTAYPRSQARRKGAGRVRSAGRIPAVIYGRNVAPQNLELDQKELETLIHHSVSETRLVDLTIAGDDRSKRLALLQQVQHHPLRGDVLHVDFREVSETEKVTTLLPVETVGEAVGVKTSGGVLEHVLFRVRVRALPRDLPEYIQVDVTNLELGNTVHISDIPTPPGVEILGDKSIPVVSVAAPKEIKEEVAEAAPAVGEVEMIKEKKEGEKAEAGQEPEKGKEAKGKAAEK